MKIRWQVLLCLGVMYASYAHYYHLWLGTSSVAQAGVISILAGLWIHLLLRMMARVQRKSWPSVLQRSECFSVVMQCLLAGLLVHLTCRTAKSFEVPLLLASSAGALCFLLPFLVNDGLARLLGFEDDPGQIQ